MESGKRRERDKGHGRVVLEEREVVRPRELLATWLHRTDTSKIQTLQGKTLSSARALGPGLRASSFIHAVLHLV